MLFMSSINLLNRFSFRTILFPVNIQINQVFQKKTEKNRFFEKIKHLFFELTECQSCLIFAARHEISSRVHFAQTNLCKEYCRLRKSLRKQVFGGSGAAKGGLFLPFQSPGRFSLDLFCLL